MTLPAHPLTNFGIQEYYQNERRFNGVFSRDNLPNKMNNVINKVLLLGDKFMPEIHLRQPQSTYSACGLFTKHEQRIQKFKETVIQTICTKMN